MSRRRAMTVLAGLAVLVVSQPVGAAAASTRDDYYQAAAGLSGDRLKDALHDIISTRVTALTYERVWDALKTTDQDPANPSKVVLVYSGTSRSKALNGGHKGEWNREHVWAKSHGRFGTTTGAGTDLYNLRPEDVEVNSLRSNKDFDNGGAPVAIAPGNLTDKDSWEPRDAAKGDVARTIFYMAVRYEGDDAFQDLEVDDTTGRGDAPRIGRVSALLKWNAEDPPDQFERRRNEIIFDRYQHNRNPFVDHPEWVDSIF
jgi:endonuclease I